MRPALIIIEGAQGAGKTTLTDYIRNSMAYTNLYRLSGHSDSTKTGKAKSKAMFDSVLRHMKDLENQDLNLVFDRTFFSEEVYTRLGYKEYSFTDLYEIYLKQLNDLDYDIYFIVLYLEDVELFRQRLDRTGKAKVDYAKFDIMNSINQQNTYLQLADEIQDKGYKNIKVIKLPTDDKKEPKDVIYNLFKDKWK